MEHFLKKIFLVRLELVHVLNGLTLNWTFTYSRTISALGLVFLNNNIVTGHVGNIWTGVSIKEICRRNRFIETDLSEVELLSDFIIGHKTVLKKYVENVKK